MKYLLLIAKYSKSIWSHRTKVIGFVSVILGVLATSTGIPEGWLKWFVLANGLVTAGVGYFNSMSAKRDPPVTPEK